jgi:hypothetical protein
MASVKVCGEISAVRFRTNEQTKDVGTLFQQNSKIPPIGRTIYSVFLSPVDGRIYKLDKQPSQLTQHNL